MWLFCCLFASYNILHSIQISYALKSHLPTWYCATSFRNGRRGGARCTRAALGAWRPNGFGPQYHASLGGTCSVTSVHTDCHPPICANPCRGRPLSVISVVNPSHPSYSPPSVFTTEHTEAASQHTEDIPPPLFFFSPSFSTRPVCSVVKTPTPASGRLTRSTRRHEDTESGFEVGLRIDSSSIRPLGKGRAPT